ncbi:hypothetical protein COEREDRAFT_78942 [Coemansia reversa NRRL 1564]|uniref:RING-type E3 ubiquitin transferase n=1 Tax=Coemansia reversa (strain ATCC 12441 / NRRL 1564) TaxID=763665 RepID=A0A2G5BKS7_COERN|nr:hypothetical protein COEREDRAFT_78942 [Coemansia reversa NRRL 1564]|eukprot:PIA19624.1 hypothetical protein COEREDRAFT_78942 [Coemansia reversa NRRL 1564]
MSSDQGTGQPNQPQEADNAQRNTSQYTTPSYWCHQCQREISPMMVPNPICPRCHGDFVEEIEAENHPRDFLAGVDAEFNEDEMENEFGGAGNYNQELQTMLQDLLTNLTGRQVAAGSIPGRPDTTNNQSAGFTRQPQQDSSTQNAGANTEGGGDERVPPNMPGGIPGFNFYRGSHGANDGQGDQQTGHGATGSDANQQDRRIPGMQTWTSNVDGAQISVSVGNLMPGDGRATGGDNAPQEGQDREHDHRPMFIDPNENAPISIGNFISSLLGALAGAPRGDGTGGAGQIFGVPIGNLGDYAWGQNSFDDIITQIMEQNQGVHAPPPASEESINQLPRRKISAEEAAAKAECGICMDEYNPGEEVMTLPCKHFYHIECIDHWLKMNGTCPICRTRIDGKEDCTHSAPPAHSDMPGSFPASPAGASTSQQHQQQQERNGVESTHAESASIPPPAPEPMD